MTYANMLQDATMNERSEWLVSYSNGTYGAAQTHTLIVMATQLVRPGKDET